MTAQRTSRLQKRILGWLLADHQRSQGSTSSSHQELAWALQADKGNISHSLRTLEVRGWIAIGRTPGGRAEYLELTPEGLEKASGISIKL